ncbi:MULTISPECIES: hypothetical protein [Roseomonadaceae]|uniref:Uncharacterized protein n=1 Tax=Falsiroseomonas oleicola TaxID=2801474 RepID=A0ABS6H7E3_9PROT|nr:hypothetical protein [Roseomonas oleicola]MBU8544364.1 hypothetical protein [Roseomonas oleicola]
MAAMLVALLSACAQPDPADPVVVLQEALAAHQASLAAIAPRPAAAGGEGSVAPAVPPPPRTTARDPGAAPGMAGQLVGHPPDSIATWFGEPRLRRMEEGAEIWHYQGPQCHLDLVFYRDEAPGGMLRVAFAAARAIGTSRRGEAACLRDIARGALPAAGPASTPAAPVSGTTSAEPVSGATPAEPVSGATPAEPVELVPTIPPPPPSPPDQPVGA